MATNAHRLAIAIAALALALAASSATADEMAKTSSPEASPPATEQPAAPRPSVIYRAPWKKQPTSDQFQKAYPARALRQNIQGRAEMTCIVGKDGSMTGCTVMLETPEGYGFGAAALKLSKFFTMRTTTPDGVSTAGAMVKIPIPFRLQ